MSHESPRDVTAALPLHPTPGRSPVACLVLAALLVLYPLNVAALIISTRGEAVMRPEVGWLTGGVLALGIAGFLPRITRRSDRVDRQAAWVVFLVAAGLNVLTLALHWPLLSDDVTRYRFDGRQWLAGRNAYTMTPALAIDAKVADAIDHLTPHRETAAIYLPTSQVAFACVAAVERLFHEPAALPGSDWRAAQRSMTWLERAGAWRGMSALLSLACTGIVLRILRQLNRSPWWAALFAWHPLVLLETAGNAHQDVLGIALMLGGLSLWIAKRDIPGVIVLMLAVFVKPIALLPALAPLRRDRRSLRAAILLGTLLLAGALLTYALGGSTLLGSMHRYGTTWEFNGGPFEFFKWLMIEVLGFEPDAMKQHLRKFGALVVALVALGTWLKGRDAVSVSAWAMAASCLVSPVLYPWYLMWPLSLAGIGTTSARWTILAFSATCVFSYAVLREPVWVLPAGVMGIEYVPVMLALIVDLWRRPAPPSRDAHPPGIAAIRSS